MTLIVGLSDRNGIVLATDSNISTSKHVARQARKNFELPHLRGGLSFAGCYSVGGVPLDEWMPRFIARPETYQHGTLTEFSDCLRKSLDSQMTEAEKKLPTLIHIAGYFVDMNGSHPEFHFVRNADEIDPVTGDYLGITDNFKADEQFWQVNCPHKSSPTGFLPEPAPYQFQFYANGLPAAREGTFRVLESLKPHLSSLWSNPTSHFHAPKTLEQSACLVRMVMSFVDSLFHMTDYPARYVGGEIQTIKIPLP